MKLKDAFKRLGFTISKQNKPNQTDVDAYNIICEVFKQTQEKEIQEHILFAKLYTLVLTEFTTYYSCVDFANKEINAQLKIPLDVHIEKLKSRLVMVKTAEFFKNNGIKDPFLFEKDANELKEVAERYPKLCPKDEFLEYYQYWDDQNIKQMLEQNINLSIQNFKRNV